MIRRLQETDLDAFRALRLDALARAPEAFGSTPEEEAALTDAAILGRLTDPSALFGALTDGRLVAIAGFAPERGPKRCHRGLLWGVYVAPGARRGGLARGVVRAVIDHAARHVLILEAAVATDNGPARALYASLGFVEFGLQRRALRVDDRFLDEALIALDLDALRAGATLAM